MIAADGDVVALNVSTGHTARLNSMLAGRAAAQIGSPGAVVQFNVGGRGYLRLVPMSTLEGAYPLGGGRTRQNSASVGESPAYRGWGPARPPL